MAPLPSLGQLQQQHLQQRYQQQEPNRNRLAILLNNIGVCEFENGRITRAFDIFSEAASITVHTDPVHVDGADQIYRYQWVECAGVYSPRSHGFRLRKQEQKRQHCYNEGMSSFLCLRALKVLVRDDALDMLRGLCPCGYAWVIWYNLAITCNLMGTRLGEKGHQLLKQANALFEHVQLRIDIEPPAKNWLLLKLSVTNNRAFICRELALNDTKLLYLKCRLADTLYSPALDCEKQEWDLFYLNLIILNSHRFAAAA